MRMRTIFGLIFFAAGLAQAQLLTPPWIELGEGGRVLARVIVDSSTACPAIRIDGVAQPMSLRTPVPAGFRPLCEFAISTTAHEASVDGQVLHLPQPDPSSVVVIGDTGCRIKGARVQDCNDMSKWPEQAVADSAARVKPDLIIHVGDYLYRESACPEDSQSKCRGTPIGDNWDTWNADFFAPAAKLLAAAPWAFARGNHEDCERAWRGWFYYLDPRPWSNICWVYTPAYIVRLGARQIVMLDSSATSEDDLEPKQVAEYTAELRSFNVEHAWLVDHHPFWGVKPGNRKGEVRALSAPLEAAWQQASPSGIDLVLSGHTHLFAVIPFDSGRPMQIVSGDGGTQLSDPVPASLDGTVIQGTAVRGSQTRTDFGFTWLRKSAGKADEGKKNDGWDLSLISTAGSAIVQCAIKDGHAACGSGGGQQGSTVGAAF